MLSTLDRRAFTRAIGGVGLMIAAPYSIGHGQTATSPSALEPLTGEAARQISHEAYVYAYPIVKNYLSIYQFALDPGGDQYKGPPGQVNNVARVFTPTDTGVITPNSDTPYSFLTMDLRAEPMVVTLPPVETGRYYSLQVVDLYTHNVDYLGTRRDGNAGGRFLIAGPGWNGATPPGIRRVIRVGTHLAHSQFRTQLLAPSDLDRVKEIQGGYRAEPLSGFLGQAPPPAPPRIDFPAISDATFDPQFWQYVNFLLQFCPTIHEERDRRARFAAIGVKAGTPWPPPGRTPEFVGAITAGAEEGRQALREGVSRLTTSVGLFGTPEEMAGKYLERAMGAMGGIYGNSPEETVYPTYASDEAGQPLDAGRSNYSLTFPPGQLPPVDAFWSVTMYDARTQFLVANALERYLVNSPMLPGLARDPDGGITLHLQHRPPGAERQANWLPAPDGPMGVVMRLYLPKQEVLDGRWRAPPIRAAGAAR